MLLAGIAPMLTVVWLAFVTPGVTTGTPLVEGIAWAPSLGLDLDLRLDAFGLLFWWLIAGIGLLVFVYAFSYFDERPELGGFAATLLVFTASMLLMVTADNLLVLFVGWELTAVTSYLLIGFEDEKAAARAGALQAWLVTGLGGLAMLAGFVLIGQAAGTYSLSSLLANPPSGVGVEVGLALVLVGAFSKSAMVPFHTWLPAAMAAPTPVSAYLHSATMVKAGVYLIARLAPSFGDGVAWWSPVVVGVGLASMILGGWVALRATDLKALLAYGTVSQLGFMVALVGMGDPTMTFAGVALVLAHALFKAPLFMSVGVIDHQAGTRDIRRLSGLGRRLPRTAVLVGIGVASMVGVIPLLGFIAKEAALEAALHGPGGAVVATTIVVGSVLTTAYGLRLLIGAFGGRVRGGVLDDETLARVGEEVRPAARLFEAPAVGLILLTVLFGVWPLLADGLVAGAAGSLDLEAGTHHLALWHGLGVPLLLSAVAIGGGLVVYLAPPLVARLGRITSRAPSTAAGYRRSLDGLNRTADRVTAIVQPGSLPFYAGVVLTTVILLGGVTLIGAGLPQVDGLVASPIQVAAATIVVGAALGTAWARRRLTAALFLGAVGYGVAVLFIIQGAPDLALTQMLVETLVLAVFVLVFWRLPARFVSTPWRLGRALRLGLSIGVGLFVAVAALLSSAARTRETGASEFLERALPEGGGRNVVNVILTDFRALDTVGEITVLVVAAIGILALISARVPDSEEGDA